MTDPRSVLSTLNHFHAFFIQRLSHDRNIRCLHWPAKPFEVAFLEQLRLSRKLLFFCSLLFLPPGKQHLTSFDFILAFLAALAILLAFGSNSISFAAL